jgi:HEAT repeat protein
MIARAMVVVLLVLIAAPARADRMSDLLLTLREGQTDQRGEACDALGNMGEAARVALPQLIVALHDRHWRGRSAAQAALVKIAQNDPAVWAALADAASDPVSDVRGAVAYALEDHALPATLKAGVPLLVRLLEDKDGFVAAEAAHALAKAGAGGAAAAPALMQAMKNENAGVRLAAASALGRMGAAAEPAVPAIRAMLGSADKWDRSNAARVLGEMGVIGAAAAPDLIKALGDTERVVRFNAAFALGRLDQPRNGIATNDPALGAAFDLGAVVARGTPDAQSMLKLLEGTKSDDPMVRELAHEAAITGGDAATPALVAALNSADDEIRWAAAVALGKLGRLPDVRAGAHADEVVRARAARLKDGDPATRGAAGSALLAFKSPRALPALLEAIKSKEWDTRADAMLALGGVKDDVASEPAALAALVVGLADENPWVRHTAIRTLGEFGPAAKPAVPRLVEMFGDRASTEIDLRPPKRPLSDEQKALLNMMRSAMKGGQVRDAVAATLGRIGPDARAAVAALIEEAKRKDRHAVDALGRIGPDAAAAVPTLAGLLADKSLGYHAAAALARIGGAGAEALVAALKDDDARFAAQEALAGGGRGVVAALTSGLAEADPQARRTMVKTLAEIGPLAAEAAPALLASVATEKDSPTRPPGSDVLEALAEMGTRAMPALIDGLTNQSTSVRLTAVLALKRLGPAAKPALPSLRTILRSDVNETVKAAAADALRAIGPGE